MFRFLKSFLKIIALSMLLIIIGAAAPSIGDDDPDSIVEIMGLGDCKATKNPWKACTCIPIDYGDITGLGDVARLIAKAVGQLFTKVFTGNWDIFNTEGPSLEKTQIDLWLQYLQEELASEVTLMQEKAMIKNWGVSHSDAFKTTFSNSLTPLQNGKAYTGISSSNTDSQVDSDFPNYTGINVMSTEEARLIKRWREMANAHMLSMNAIGKRYDTEKSVMDAFFNEIFRDPSNNSINFMSTATSQITSGMMWAVMDGSPQYPFTSLMPKAATLWAKLQAEKAISSITKKASILDDVPDTGQTKMLQIVGGMTDNMATLIDRNDDAFGKFLDIRSATEQRERARTQAIQTNMVEISKKAAGTKSSGKSYNLGF